MTIRWSLLIGLAMMAALGALLGGGALLGNASLQRGMLAQADRLAAVDAASAAQLAFERADRAAQASARAPDPASAHVFADQFRAEAAHMQAALASAARLDPALKALVGDATDWLQQTDRRLPGSSAGEQTSLLREDLMQDRRDATQRRISRAVESVLRRSARTWDAASQRAGEVEAIILVLVTLSFAGGLVLALLLVRRVLRPLGALTASTRHIAAGELDLPVLDTEREDEIGDVARALDALRRRAIQARAVEATAARERRATEDHIRHLAQRDPLTGLVNRAMLQEQLEGRLARAAHNGEKLALFCIDLDGFKAFNDIRGHAAGDALLRETARRLRAVTRESDTVARVGGDQFIVVAGVEARDPGRAETLAGQIVEILAEPCDIADGDQAIVTASVGVVRFPDDGDSIDALLAHADTAVDQAKQQGRNGHAFFRPEMDVEAQNRRVLEQDLRLAESRGELSLAYQPQVDLKSEEVVGFETLLRWTHPRLGNIMPDVLIPIAESTLSIMPIGKWVLRQACTEAMRWTKPLRIAVNVSPAQFAHCDVAALIAETLADTGLPPSRLEIEVTESMLMQNSAATLETLGRIRDSGVSIAMDDFGTGYSSLSTLRAFPFDRIKVDRSFVKDLATSSEAATIVHAVLGLASGLGLPVVAEGIEDSSQLAMLRAANCAEGQGYLFGKPSPIGCFAEITHPLPPVWTGDWFSQDKQGSASFEKEAKLSPTL